VSKPYQYLCLARDAKAGMKDVIVEALDKGDARKKLEAQGLEVRDVLIPTMSTHFLGIQSDPKNLFLTAKHFLEGHQIINKNYPNPGELCKVKLFLLGHSLELGLNAFLLTIPKKYNLGFLRKGINMSHDLEKGMVLVEKEGFLFNNDEKEIILSLNKHYKDGELEYQKMEFESLPWSNIENVCINFLEKIENKIKSN